MNTTTNMMKDASNGVLLTAILGDSLTAWRVEEFLKTSPRIPTAEDLKRIKGVGPATAEKILAVCELSARYIVGTEQVTVTAPEDVIPRLCWLKYEQQEHFMLVTLDSANHIIGVHELTKGLANKTAVHPREAFRAAIADDAVSVMFAHNHPSGNTEPSAEDMSITRVLCAAGRILQIPVLDHLILSKAGFTSICRQAPEIFEETFKKEAV